MRVFNIFNYLLIQATLVLVVFFGLINSSYADSCSLDRYQFQSKNKTLFSSCRKQQQLVDDIKGRSLSFLDKSMIYGLVAKSCHKSKQKTIALKYLEKAIYFAQKANDNTLLSCWYIESAIVNKKLGNKNRAERLLKTVESFKSSSQDIFSKFNGNILPIQELGQQERVKSLLHELKSYKSNSQRALALSDRIFSILDSQKVDKINNYFEEDCVQQKGKNFSSNLTFGQAVLYPIFIDNKTVKFLLRTHNKVFLKDSHISEQVLNNEIYTFISKYIPFDNNDMKRKLIKKQASLLYKSTLGLFSQQLSNNRISNLIIVPDRSLGMLPWTGLYSNKLENWVLFEKYAISVVPGLSLLTIKNGKIKPQILFAGYAEGDIKQGVNNELEFLGNKYKSNISILYSGSKQERTNYPLLGKLTERNLRWAMSTKPHSILHLSTHAYFQGKKKNGISLEDKKRTILPFKEFSRLIKSSVLQKKGVDLIFFSACETAKSRFNTTQANLDWKSNLGLTSMAIRSGVSSVIGSIMKIDSKATELLTRYFYENLNRDISMAHSLQKAQQQVFNESYEDKPNFWSTIILVGDWH